MANAIGPDVSLYDDDPETPQGIDFAKLKSGANFVIVRAGQNLWPDPNFKSNWRDAKIAGLPRGAYWYLDNRVEPKRQAELYAALFEGDFGELPVFVDLEDSTKGQYSGWRKWYDFLERLKQLIPHSKEIAIYTAFFYWRDHAPNATLQTSSLEYFHQYPLWIAGYQTAQPAVPKPWGQHEWLFWQFSETGDGKLYGVESNAIDLNYFNGDLAAFRTRFKLSDTPPPPPGPPPAPPPMTGSKHKVTTAALRVREGPGTNFTAIGMVYFGEIVEELDATNDRSWIKIRNKDGIVGWCSSAYLVRISGPSTQPPPPPPTEPPPVPGDETKPWYRVNTSALTVRATADANGKVLGYLIKNDTVPALDDTSNPSWLQMRRIDGLSGWVGKSFLVPMGSARPQEVRQNIFYGVTYMRKELAVPRKNVMHVLAIDLTTTTYEFLVTPSKNSNGVICTRTTSQFLDEFKLNLAINGDGFNYIDTNADPTPYCVDGGDPVHPNGLAASRGVIYSQVKSPQPTVYIGQKNQFTFEPRGRIFNAVSGDRLIVDAGAVAKNLATNVPNPRTALGLNKNGRWLILMVVDGRETDYSQGLTLPELAAAMISYGVYTGVNMDGGGSSTMVIRGVDGVARVLNSPVDQNIPGRERAVANHLGLFIRK